MTAIVLTGGWTTSASALTQSTGVASCSTEVRVASKTTGQTIHATSANQMWDKGYKNNAGATSYTGYKRLQLVQTTAPTIASSGFACR
ncbi:hypothetical protein [Cellulomonas hominis]